VRHMPGSIPGTVRSDSSLPCWYCPARASGPASTSPAPTGVAAAFCTGGSAMKCTDVRSTGPRLSPTDPEMLAEMGASATELRFTVKQYCPFAVVASRTSSAPRIAIGAEHRRVKQRTQLLFQMTRNAFVSMRNTRFGSQRARLVTLRVFCRRILLRESRNVSTGHVAWLKFPSTRDERRSCDESTLGSNGRSDSGRSEHGDRGDIDSG
jgi:hypothetical protein